MATDMFQEINAVLRKHFHQALNTLLDINETQRGLCREQKKWLSKEHYLREFGTLYFGVQRQIGKSYFIADHMGENDLVIAKNQFMADTISERSKGKCEVISQGRCLNNYHHFYCNRKTYDNIWIDELSPKELGITLPVVYRDFATVDSTIIILGTPAQF